MHKVIHRFILIYIFLVINLFAYFDDFKKHVSGKLELVSTASGCASNLYNISNNKRIKDLSAPNNCWLSSIGLMYEIEYALSDNNSIYLGTPFFDDYREGLTLGQIHYFSDDSRLDLSVFANVLNVWENPYIEYRTSTELLVYGFTLDYSQIFNSGLDMFYRLKYNTIPNDIIGEIYKDYKRDGKIHEFALRYDYQINDSSNIIPGIYFFIGNMDGAIESFKGLSSDIAYSFNSGKYSFYSSISIGALEYNKTNVIFDAIRKDYSFNAGLILTKYKLFNKDNWYTRYGLGTMQNNSNINFFDSNNYLFGITIGFNF